MHSLARTLAVALLVNIAGPVEAGDVVLRIGEHTIEAEVADTQKKRERGLMHRDSLAANKGMLFVFSEPGRYSFWMANTKIPLDAAFIDGKGVILQVVTMLPGGTTLYSSPENTFYALETNAGWFKRRSIGMGARVHGLKTFDSSPSTEVQ